MIGPRHIELDEHETVGRRHFDWYAHFERLPDPTSGETRSTFVDVRLDKIEAYVSYEKLRRALLREGREYMRDDGDTSFTHLVANHELTLMSAERITPIIIMDPPYVQNYGD